MMMSVYVIVFIFRRATAKDNQGIEDSWLGQASRSAKPKPLNSSPKSSPKLNVKTLLRHAYRLHFDGHCQPIKWQQTPEGRLRTEGPSWIRFSSSSWEKFPTTPSSSYWSVWIRLQGSPVALITRHVRTMEADFESMLEQVVRQPTDYWGTPPLQTYSNAYKHNSFYTNQDNNRVSLGPFARRPRHLIIIVIGLVSIGFLDPPH